MVKPGPLFARTSGFLQVSEMFLLAERRMFDDGSSNESCWMLNDNHHPYTLTLSISHTHRHTDSGAQACRTPERMPWICSSKSIYPLLEWRVERKLNSHHDWQTLEVSVGNKPGQHTHIFSFLTNISSYNSNQKFHWTLWKTAACFVFLKCAWYVIS